MFKLLSRGLLAGTLVIGFVGVADAQARKARLARDGSPEQLERKAKRNAALAYNERVARRECIRYRGWGDQYRECLTRYRTKS